MEKLFKYINKEHSKAFFDEGNLKIGTLYEYRNEEFYGSTIGDSEEGSGSMVTRFKSIDDHSSYYKKKNQIENKDGPNLTNVRITSVKLIAVLSESDKGLISTTYSDDCYIYCVSSEFNKRTMKKFCCDTCIEIFNPSRFFEEISNIILEQCTFEGYWSVVYRNRLAHYSKRHNHPYVLMKDHKYKNQKEVRAIWKPKAKIEGPLEGPLYIKVPKARKYCRMYKA